MVDAENQITSVYVALKVAEILRNLFCCPNRRLVFSPENLTAKHRLGGQNPSQHEITQ